MIFSIGDSHIRSLSYNNSILPIFLGPAAFNNFTNPKNSESTKEKISFILKKVPAASEIVIWLSGDVQLYHNYCSKKKNFNSAHKELMEYASNYLETILELEEFEHNLIIVGSVCNTGFYQKLTELYNNILEEGLIASNVTFVDPLKLINLNGKVFADINLDNFHISADFCQYLLKYLSNENLAKPGIDFHQNYEFKYLYDIKENDYNYKIWGDCSYIDLKLNGNETHLWDKYHQHTIFCINAIKYLFGQKYDSLKPNLKKKVLIFDAKEGFASFELLKIGFNDISVIEKDHHMHRFFSLINSIFYEAKVKAVSKVHKSYDFIINLEMHRYSLKAKIDLINTCSTSSKVFYYSSYNTNLEFEIIKKHLPEFKSEVVFESNDYFLSIHAIKFN